MALHLVASFSSSAEFLTAFDAEVARGGLLVRGADAAGSPAMTECTLEVAVAGQAAVKVPARVAAVVPGVGVAVMLEGLPAPLASLATALRSGGALPAAETVVAEAAPDEADEGEAPPRLLSERLKTLNVTEKMQLALSGSREERMALLRDVNKVLHAYVLRNPRIGLDEVQQAAKQASLSPDALKLIAEHREWSGNGVICTSLVRNPKTPLPLALKLLDRVPMTDLRAFAKGGARDQIVNAARKKLAAG